MLPREFLTFKASQVCSEAIFGHYQQHLIVFMVAMVVVMYVCTQYPFTKDGKLGTHKK